MRGALPVLLLIAVAASGCDTLAGGRPGADRELTVLAASSLTEPFTELAARFESRHPGVDVVTGFDSSATLAGQVAAGAPADVVATADRRTMRSMVAAGALDGAPVVFARNRLALVVPADNPAGITELADLDRADYVACTASAPCGRLAAGLLASAGVTRRARSLEVDVKAVLTKVRLGEADAGLVYASDVVAAGEDVREVPLPAVVSTSYQVGVTEDARATRLARRFVALVLSPQGQRVLARAGFDAPAGSDGRRADRPHGGGS